MRARLGGIERLWEGIACLIGTDEAGRSPNWSWHRPTRDEWRAMRPSLPVLLWLALGVWPATAASLKVLRLAGAADCRLWALAGFIGASIGCLVIVVRRRRLGFAVLLIGLSLGVLCGASAAVRMHDAQADLWGQCGSWEVTCTQDSRLGSFGATVEGRTMTPAGRTATVRINLADTADLMAGERIRMQATWRQPGETASAALWDRGVVATTQVASFERMPASWPAQVLCRVRRAAVERLAGAPQQVSADGAQFLQAVLLGWRESLFDASWYAAAKSDGLAHLVAVSGAHLAIVCGIVSTLLTAARTSRRARLICQVVLVLIYLTLTGAPISAIRAAFMAVLGLSAFLVRRRAYSLGALSFALIAMIVTDPVCSCSLSFVLSAGATLGIVLFARGIEE